MKNEKLYAIFLGGFSIALVAFALAVPVQGLRKKQLDQQTAAALSEVETALAEYSATNNGEIPKSVNDLEFDEHSSLKDNKNTLSRITIEGSGEDYKLCGFFYTDTKSDDNENEEIKADIGSTVKYALGGGLYGSRFSVHDKGNFCFEEEDYSIDDYSSDSNFIDSYSDEGSGSSADDKSKDAERKSAINSIYGQVEVYFAENGNYPSFDDMNSSEFRSSKFIGADSSSFSDPEGMTDKFANLPMKNIYSYETTPMDCDNVSQDCTGIILSATLSNGEIYEKTGSNN